MSSSDTGWTKAVAPRHALAIGVLVAGVGLYFMLVGAGLLPVPGGRRGLNAPLWIVAVCGLPFFLGGISVAMHAFAGTGADGELPAGAPAWLRVAQYLVGLAIFASFALVGSWIALAGSDRGFSGPGGVGVARIMFGIGALIAWLATAGYAVQGARKLFAPRKS
jgi:hypothetical protein